MKKIVSLLRFVGIMEGISYLVLLGVAMPLKYLAGSPLMVQVTGSLHGFLFVAYVLLAVMATWLFRWPIWVFAQAVVASLLPGGTFWMDRKFAKLEAEKN